MKKNYPLPGEKWRHYKGETYEIVTLAKNTEKDEILVIHQSLSFGTIYSTPLSMWEDTVNNRRGGLEPRFLKLDI